MKMAAVVRGQETRPKKSNKTKLFHHHFDAAFAAASSELCRKKQASKYRRSNKGESMAQRIKGEAESEPRRRKVCQIRAINPAVFSTSPGPPGGINRKVVIEMKNFFTSAPPASLASSPVG